MNEANSAEDPMVYNKLNCRSWLAQCCMFEVSGVDVDVHKEEYWPMVFSADAIAVNPKMIPEQLNDWQIPKINRMVRDVSALNLEVIGGLDAVSSAFICSMGIKG